MAATMPTANCEQGGRRVSARPGVRRGGKEGTAAHLADEPAVGALLVELLDALDLHVLADALDAHALLWAGGLRVALVVELAVEHGAGRRCRAVLLVGRVVPCALAMAVERARCAQGEAVPSRGEPSEE